MTRVYSQFDIPLHQQKLKILNIIYNFTTIMVKLNSFLVLFACVLGMQALAKSGTLRFEDFLLRDTSHVIHGTLDNGFQYYIVKEVHQPFQMSLLQKTGFHDDGETPEISHLLEHMLATANRPIATGDTLIQYLKKLGKEYGSGFNAFTGANYMKFDLYQLKSELAYADSCMEILSEIAEGSKICAEDLERQRTRMINEVANRKYVLNARQADANLGVFRFGYDPAEWREVQLNSAKKITLSQLEAFYRKWYHPQNQCLLVTGNVPDGIEKIIKRKFGSHPRVPAPSPTILDFTDKNMLIERWGSTACSLTLNFALPILTQAEKTSPNFFRDYFALKQINHALNEKIRERKFASNFVTRYQVAERLMLTATFTCDLNEELPGGGLQTFVDSVAALVTDVRSNGVKIKMPKDTLKKGEVALRCAQIMKRLQEGNGEGNTIDRVLPPDVCFIYSLPLYKQENSDAYWTFVLSGKDISDYCKNFINKSKITIECVLPYDYPEKEITEKLNALLRH